MEMHVSVGFYEQSISFTMYISVCNMYLNVSICQGLER